MILSSGIIYFIVSALVIVGVASVFVPSKKKGKTKSEINVDEIPIVDRLKREGAEPYVGEYQDLEFQNFIEQSELFQPFMNLSILSEGFWIDEISPASFRVLTTFFPSYGRNYDLFGLDAKVGRSFRLGSVSLTPCNNDPAFRTSDQTSDWATIHVQLGHNISEFFGAEVNSLIRALARAAVNGPTSRQNVVADVLANKAILEACWDQTFHSASGLGIKFELSGAFHDFHEICERWGQNGVDPWRGMNKRLEWLVELEERKDDAKKSSP